ncbi:MAG TPA: alpha/beta hydrolase [Thermoanaerobaculia bacterium]|nr:alpha/beta hydrolase [Thermoanaerobaculia bacterium]
MSGQVLILPGLYNSGSEHWQTHWEKAHPDFKRVEQDDWDRPRCSDWIARLEDAVREAGPDTVLVAHSLACNLVVRWAEATRQPREWVRGALLVAPSDVEAPSYPEGTEGFKPMPRNRLPFPSIVVASSDDPYVTLERAGEFARAWGSKFVDIGPAGHVNSASRLGDWLVGFALLERLRGGEKL